MYLKALEIQGFKSFPDKTVLNFGEGITAIVGPNGSGKSNISDAISWVMGEQSARSLRGGKMEDVIFGGTEKRNAVGFAQVTLTLDNSQRIFPGIDASEVMVTRRYYRSGDSEYYINKQSARLKDISELFMDTGMGREGYALIGQGRIDEILSVRSADRREIFEEAAGISKYRCRKEESERKLERTEENLVRINDKIAELELQVIPLRQQAEKAKRYLILRDELRLLEISLWLDRLEEIKVAVLRLQTECAQAKERKDAANARLEALYQESEAFSRKMHEIDLSQEQIREAASRLEQQAASQDSAVSALRTAVKHQQESIHLLEQEISDQDVRNQGMAAQMDEQRRRLDTIAQRRETLVQELEALLKEADAAAQKAGGAAKEAAAIQAKGTCAAEEAAQSRARQAALSAAQEQMEDRLAAVREELSAADDRLADARREEQDANRRLKEARENLQVAGNVVEGYTIRLNSRNRRKEAADEALLQATMERNALQSRIRLLAEMEKEYEGFNKAVRVVMQAAEKNVLPGVHGPVASLMRTEGQYAVALETALGAGLQNIVVDQEEYAKAAIMYLKQREGGRATFLPLTAIRGDELREPGLEREPGFTGIASQLVQFAPVYGAVFRNLLGRTVVVEDLDSGIAIARRYAYRFRIVTLDGQVIHRGGSMTGGSVSCSAGILSRTYELETIRRGEAASEAAVAAALEGQRTAGRELEAARYELETAESNRRSASDDVIRRQGQLERCQALRESLFRSREDAAGEEAALTQRIANAQARLAEIEQAGKEQERLAEKFRQEAEEKLSGQTEWLALSRQLAEEQNARKEELAGLAAEEDATRRAWKDMEQVCQDMEGDRATRMARLQEYQKAIAAAETEIEQKTAETVSLRMQAQDCQQQLSVLLEERLQLEKDQGAMGKRIKEYNDETLEAERQAAALEQKISAGEWEEKQLLDKLWETYELSHAAAMAQRVALESVAKANRRVAELKRDINALGSVNVGAIEEFERINDRYSYFTSQRDDIDKAKKELLGIIRQITQEMTAIFQEQFSRINTAFQETFLDLFGGGQAALELEDKEQILDCGIEIRVQPPGKTLRTLTLLSGGEKAFVAIALYFAILKVHPTPFCVMDEIEAALDDANVTRFAQYMRGVTDTTQFIVITHRRGTMEEADVLYGVTMQEKGVSKMLTIHMDEMAQELGIR